MITVKELRADIFEEKISFVSLGRLSHRMVEFIISKRPDLKEILSPDRDILFWKDRISHTERHKKDFISENEFMRCFKEIPKIIHCPDYISVHPKDNSISFIKDLSMHVSVAVKISSDGKMSYRTMYPLMDAQLSHYIDLGHAWKYDKSD